MSITTLQGDCRETLATLPAGSIQCVVTSPPYFGLRKYSDDPREIGQEPTPAAYVAALMEVFSEVWRVLRHDGTLWLNLGDSYAQDSKWGGASGGKNYTSAAGDLPRSKRASGLKDKDLIGIPWRVAFALQDAGWYLRSDIVWSKPNAMPESVTDRPTRAHEYVFLLSKSKRYYYDAAAIAEPQIMKPQQRLTPRDANPDAKVHGMPAHRRPEGGTGGGTRNRRTVWQIATQPYPGAHYATMPEALIEPCILAGSAARACEHCGAAWERVVEKVGYPDPENNTETQGRMKASGEKATDTARRKTLSGAKHAAFKRDNPDKFMGFAPGCDCENNTGSAASVVLDPFGGSGTVGKVAMRLQRKAILCELNPDYITEHIEKRTDGVQVELFV